MIRTVEKLFVVCAVGALFINRQKNKISPITGLRCPEDSRKLRLPDYVTMAQDDGKVVNLTHRPLLPPRKYSWYSFL